MNEVKFGKLRIIASYTCNLSSCKLLQGSKNIAAFRWTVQKSYWLFFVGSLDWELDFKIRISFASHSQEKENDFLCLALEETGATTSNSW